MAWGALMGLGNGLQQVGGMLEDKSKREVAEKLAREREDRSEDRLRAKEDRQVARENAAVARVGINPTTGMKEFFNRNEELLRAEPASAYELDSLKLAQQKEQAGLAKVLADTQYSQVRANTAAGKAELDQQLLRARIGTEGARQDSLNRANRDTGTGGSSGQPATREAAIEELVKSINSQLKSANMSPAEAYQYAETALAQAETQRKAGRNVDPKRLLSTIIFNNARPKPEDED